jgi:hypothetical protein
VATTGFALTVFTGACGSSRGSTQSKATFCTEVVALSRTAVPSDGGFVVGFLRRLDLTGLAPTDRSKVSTAIAVVEKQIANFQTGGQNSDGWSTQPVTDLASRICGVEIRNFHVTP